MILHPTIINYQLMLLQQCLGDFIVTVTRNGLAVQAKKVRAKRKEISSDIPTIIYSFASFDDVINFCRYAKLELVSYKVFADKNTALYEYNNEYYIVFKKITMNESAIKKFCSSVAEFGKYINHADLFERKLSEYGKKILSKSVISTINKNF